MVPRAVGSTERGHTAASVFSMTSYFPPVKGDSGATCDIMAHRRADLLMRAGEERGTLEGMWHGRKNRGHSA